MNNNSDERVEKNASAFTEKRMNDKLINTKVKMNNLVKLVKIIFNDKKNSNINNE